MTFRPGVAAALSLLVLAAPAAAQRQTGTFFAGQPVDGPSADIRSVGDVDVARDGAGLITYVRRDGPEDHLYVSLIDSGTAQGPFRLDGGQPELIGRPVAATANGGRMAVAWANAAGVWVAVRAAHGQAFAGPQQIAPPGAKDPAVDLAINGAGYVAWSHDGNVYSAYMARSQTAFTGHPAPLDLDVARDAGSGPAASPRVTASADGVGLAAWGERDAAGVLHLVVRRMVRERVSVTGAEANVASVDGLAATSAEMPDIAFEDDSSYAWVAFRQQVLDAGGATITRAVARRLRGSGFDDAATIDGGAALTAGALPRVGLNGRGQGIFTVEVPGGALASIVKDDIITPARVLGAVSASGAQPVAGFAENFDGVTAWVQPSLIGVDEVRGRLLEDDAGLSAPPPFGPDVLLSDPALGAVDAAAGLDADVTRAGDAVVAFVQAGADGRRLVLAAYDRSPGEPTPTTSTGWRRTTRPELAWAGAFDVWGGINYSLLLDGLPLGATGDIRFTPGLPLADGIHRWQVIATDRRGQITRGPSRNLRIDGTPPKLLVKIAGKRIKGRRIAFAVRAIDLRSPAGSGISQVRIDYRDGTLPVITGAERPIFSHSFARKGTFIVRISATDAAGNAVVAYRTVKVKAPKKKSKKKSGKRSPGDAPQLPPAEPETPATTEPEPAVPVPVVPPGEPAPDPGGTGAGT